MTLFKPCVTEEYDPFVNSHDAPQQPQQPQSVGEVHRMQWRWLLLQRIPERLMVVDNADVYVSNRHGLWMSTEDNVAMQDIVMEMHGSAQSVREAVECAHQLETLRFNRPREIRTCQREDLNKIPLVQAPTNAVFDLRSGEVLEPTQVRDCLSVHGSLPVVEYYPDLLNEPPPGVLEAMQHYGEGLFRRLAWQMLGPHKSIDVVRMPISNSGKSTLALWVSRALRGGVAVLDSYSQLRDNAEFSELRHQLTIRMLVFLDEADKVDIPPAISRVNEMTSDSLRVNIKHKQEIQLPRKGNAILLGADWPNITLGQGADNRFRWAHSSEVGEMRPGLRDLLMGPEAACWLATWLIEQAAWMWARNDDGTTDASRAAAARNLDSTLDPLMLIMADLLIPQPGNFLPNRDIQIRVVAHPMAAEVGDVKSITKGSRWRSAVLHAVLGATADRTGQLRGYRGVGLRDPNTTLSTWPDDLSS